jgi:hypothetical protein
VDVFGGYVASLPSYLQRVQGDRHARALFGVNYRIGLKPSADDQREIFAGKDALKIYSVPGAFPRAWTVHEVLQIASEEESGIALSRPLEEHRRRAFLTGPAPRLETCPGSERASVVERLADRLTVEAVLNCRGLVAIGETWDPGWRATVDGRPAPVLRVYGALRGVVVEGGTHRIEMRYRPWTVFAGAGLSFAGVLAAALLLWRR